MVWRSNTDVFPDRFLLRTYDGTILISYNPLRLQREIARTVRLRPTNDQLVARPGPLVAGATKIWSFLFHGLQLLSERLMCEFWLIHSILAGRRRLRV
jgi:hypothetical protein